MELIEITDRTRELDPWHYEQIEEGKILFFPQMPIEFPEEDWRFLLRQRQSDSRYYKNIAYRPARNIVTGVASGSDREELRRILKAYSRQAEELLARLLPRYAMGWRLDYTSFRPFEEEGRELSLHSRNDLLHVDAFPTRPTNGDRILRFFTNINPEEPRVWITSQGFGELATAYAREAGLLEMARPGASSFRNAFAGLARRFGLRRLAASPYDAFMKRFHDFLKENQRFQETCPKDRIEFPARSSWLVFTDMVSHAVLGGQFALEQTFIVSRRAMQRPEQAPVSVLERLAGVPLTWRD